jgi:hypothetical protein
MSLISEIKLVLYYLKIDGRDKFIKVLQYGARFIACTAITAGSDTDKKFTSVKSNNLIKTLNSIYERREKIIQII